MRGQLSTTCRWCTTGGAWCVTMVAFFHQPCQTLSAAIRIVNPQEREATMSQLCQSNGQQETGRTTWS